MIPTSPNVTYHPLSKDMIIITDYSIKFNTSKAKNDFDALIKFRKLYSDFISSFSLSSIELCTNLSQIVS